ncbi:peptidoglycan-binding protein [Burkholderia ubonensis]|uniref:glycoside hydrolase family protein n=1 Tax=Burkholderia ubonensis TaxID=101571 RepID=UPI0007540D0A|nr:LysM peptidoglycan-binding domain-containing protein [Burkholderia ubonensis]KVN68795.1 peptidoglycan-binding protein [Burkholderia ubonensis]KWI06817.1 peptidoglycan-binding protein [Burkholderia ubonensis]KWI37850.1 peptidoglycan-binding protein [Burkholderia ubonensis]ODQ41266.1 peptidoglycan-binding protein [Burkholderia ubonensis]OJA23716.1 peptidoglycan-binding protein [Burkholderia ubonensis]
MAKSNNTNDALSAVTVYFKDHFGQPIQNLKVEIKGMEERAEHVYHTASTNAQGAVEFSVRVGEALSVHVKRWTSDSMKEIARLNAALSQIKFHLTSPKTRHELPTKTDDGTGGDYWRGTYKVKAHDNLTVIARKYHTSVDLLKHVNHLKSDLIVVGQVLKVPPVDSRKSDSPAPKKPDPKGAPPKNDQDNNDRGAPTTTPRKGGAPIIFPIKVRPLNDEGGSYGTPACNYTWNAPLGAPGHQAARFRANREKGRKHAGRDLYVEKLTDIVAIAPGVVIKCENFYMQTHQISVHHTTTDGRQFIALYGEVAPHSIKVKLGDVVSQGQVLAQSGVLMKKDNTLLVVAAGKNVSMLHFEMYSGAAGFDPNSKLNGCPPWPLPFNRRGDLIDSLPILQEGYRATFLDAPPLKPVGNRIPINQLRTSDRGKEFVKCWESVKYDPGKQNTYYYNDKNGYCTVGWGHLVDKKSCASLGFMADVSKISIEEAQAFFEKDVLIHEGYVKGAITAPLYQHEFDALVSLAFNVGHISTVAPKLCQKINACDYTGAPVEFLDMDIPKRRKKEHDMFCNNVYDASH